MEHKKTLKELFESRKNELSEKLSTLSLPKDLLNAQQSMIGEFSLPKFAEGKKDSEDKQQPEGIPVSNFGSSLKKEQYPYVVGGTTVGGMQQMESL